MSAARRLLLSVLLCAPAAPVVAQSVEPGQDFTGTVVEVTDGDTYTVDRTDGGTVPVRLWGVDAPEPDQPYGTVATRTARQLVQGKRVRVVVREVDRRRRAVARVEVQGTSLGRMLMRRGLARPRLQYGPQVRDSPSFQRQPRTADRGLWSRSSSGPSWGGQAHSSDKPAPDRTRGEAAPQPTEQRGNKDAQPGTTDLAAVTLAMIVAFAMIAALALLYWLFRTLWPEKNTRHSEKNTRTPSSRDAADESPIRTRAGSRLSEGRVSASVQRSPNGQYRVLPIEPTANQTSGSLALGQTEGDVLWEKAISRPNNPSVSNDGTVVVENRTPAGLGALSSEFLVFDERGEKLLEERCEAMALGSGITPEGKLAWFTTANADDDDSENEDGDNADTDRDDGDQLFVYDLQKRERILATELPMRGVEQVLRLNGGLEILIDGLRCRYEDGEMVDSGDLQAQRWAREERKFKAAKSPRTVADLMKQRLDRVDQLSEDQIRSTIDTARNFDGSEGDRAWSGGDQTWAKIWGRKGALHQYLGAKRQALEEYERALSLDGQLGVQHKARRLRQELADPTEAGRGEP